MRNRIALLGAAIVLLASALAVATQVSMVSGTSPPPTVFVTSNTTLTQNVNASFVIASSNVTLDCARHWVISPGAKIGILVENETGVTVERCNVEDFETGYALVDAPHATLSNDTAVHNSLDGYLVTSTADTLTWDNATDSGADGFAVASGNVLRGVTATGNWDSGIRVNSQVSVVDSLSSANSGDGFTASGVGDVFTNDSAIGNGGNGFTLGSAERLQGDIASRNAFDGFSLASASADFVSGSAADHNLRIGFSLTSAHNNTIASDEACGNAHVDVYQDAASSGNLFTNDTFCTSSGVTFAALYTNGTLSSPRRSG